MPIIPSYPPRKMTQNSWTPLMMLCTPFQSWTSLTKLSVILRNMDQTCSNLYGTSSAFSASSAPPDCVPKCPPLHTPPHPILPFLTYSTVPHRSQMWLLLSSWPCRGQVLPQRALDVPAQPPLFIHSFPSFHLVSDTPWLPQLHQHMPSPLLHSSLTLTLPGITGASAHMTFHCH